MSVRQIIRAFEAWRAAGEPLVLATVFETLGSTYSKAGQRIVIAANGDYRGLVSGGCLEGDLAERARAVLETGEPRAVTYDLRDEADELFGLGVGCNGLIRVFLQPLTVSGGYEPFATIAASLTGSTTAGVATVIETATADFTLGATAVVAGDVARAWGAEGGAAEQLVRSAREASAGPAELKSERRARILLAPLRPIPRLLVLGAGLDAVPLVGMAAELGWFVTVADHRPAYLRRGGFERAEQSLLVAPGQIGAVLEVTQFDAIVVMSHHLESDRKYLRELAAVSTRYLGVLGPKARRERLLADLDAEVPQLRKRLKGPVGLDIRANSPESIALSILAELQTVFAA